jgi:outer membrane protein insertion porin family
LRAQIGTQRKDFILAITEPYFLDRRLSLGGQAFYTEANYLSSVYDQRNYGFALEARKPILPYVYGTLGYRLEEIEIFNVEAGVSPEIRDQAGSQLKSTILSSLVYDRRDNPLLTRTGQRIAFSPFVSGGFLGGDTQIYGGDVEGSQYFHLPWDLILLFNGEAAVVQRWGGNRHKTLFVTEPQINPLTGKKIRDSMGNVLTMEVPQEFSTVPIFDRLYLGGSNNLRGFTFRDVGPRDEHGEPLGGLTMARTTVEITFPIIEKARGAFFYDRGYVDSNVYAVGSEHWGSDFGFGLRLDLPIGPLRVDYGIPIEKDGRSGSGRFNFNVGYQF